MFKFSALLAVVSLLPAFVSAQAPLYGQCGGIGWSEFLISLFASFITQQLSYYVSRSYDLRLRFNLCRLWRLLFTMPVSMEPTKFHINADREFRPGNAASTTAASTTASTTGGTGTSSSSAPASSSTSAAGNPYTGYTVYIYIYCSPKSSY